MAEALEQLQARARDLGQLSQLGMLLSWDQRTQMPPAGARGRGEHMAFIQRLAHDFLVDPEMGRLLDELEPRMSSLDPDGYDYGLIRLLRKAYDKETKVPVELRGEMARAAAEGNAGWLKAKASSDFQLFLP